MREHRNVILVADIYFEKHANNKKRTEEYNRITKKKRTYIPRKIRNSKTSKGKKKRKGVHKSQPTNPPRYKALVKQAYNRKH